ncbi:hypothetical protein Z948_3192 [Sulfitobacter donghicola DSW-25 = KCTC 12864 = JCM 14565]|nr:hypothetical protein Z948_3192 [Sulfitobacter donghicola DSW-25 = KCTC 12864 = JCM 14565]
MMDAKKLTPPSWKGVWPLWMRTLPRFPMRGPQDTECPDIGGW